MFFASRNRFLAVVVTTCAALVGVACAPKITNYAYLAPGTYPARAEDARIEVFDATLVGERSQLGIDREYEVIARFEVHENLAPEGNLVEEARQKAREIGGDAIIYREHDQNLLVRRSGATVLVLKYVDGTGGL